MNSVSDPVNTFALAYPEPAANLAGIVRG